MHVHVGERHCLEVTVLRGPSAEIRHLGDDLVAAKGVLHGEVVLVGSEVDFSRWHGVPHATEVA
jgi:CopG family nickel-responsive transcriptional regulator